MSAPRTNGLSSAGKRTLSLSMSAAETQAALSAGALGGNGGAGSGQGKEAGLHPLKHSWVFWFLNRHVGEKIASPSQYEESIKKVGGFASIESFWTIYSHLHSPSALPPVTDILLFTSQIRRPIWEEVPKGAKFTIRLRKGLADRLWEAAVLAAVGDQFEEQDGVVGVVLSVRAQEDVISVWTERSYTDGGARVKDTIYRLLNLPPSTTVDYKLNVDLIQSTARPASDGPLPRADRQSHPSRGGTGASGSDRLEREHSHGGHSRHHGGRERSSNGHRRDQQQPSALSSSTGELNGAPDGGERR